VATSPQTLADESACYICVGATEFQAFELALLARIVAGGITPAESDTRITEEGDTRVTEGGDTRITE